MSRAEAARINGAKSRGPKTEAGKAVSSQNALHHGITAAQIVIRGEDPAEFEELLADLVTTYGPATPVEHDLIAEMAAARWRLRRLPRMERAIFESTYHRVQNEPEAAGLTPDLIEMRVWAEVTNCPEMKQIHRHETRLRRAWEKARLELETLIATRGEIAEDGDDPPAPEPRTAAVAAAAQGSPADPHAWPAHRPVQNEPVSATSPCPPLPDSAPRAA